MEAQWVSYVRSGINEVVNYKRLPEDLAACKWGVDG